MSVQFPEIAEIQVNASNQNMCRITDVILSAMHFSFVKKLWGGGGGGGGLLHIALDFNSYV